MASRNDPDAWEDDDSDWVKGDDVAAYWKAWRNIRTIKPPPEPEDDRCNEDD